MVREAQPLEQEVAKVAMVSVLTFFLQEVPEVVPAVATEVMVWAAAAAAVVKVQAVVADIPVGLATTQLLQSHLIPVLTLPMFQAQPVEEPITGRQVLYA